MMTNELRDSVDDQIIQTKLNRNHGHHWQKYYLCENVSWLIKPNSGHLACVAQACHIRGNHLNRAPLQTQQTVGPALAENSIGSQLRSKSLIWKKPAQKSPWESPNTKVAWELSIQKRGSHTLLVISQPRNSSLTCQSNFSCLKAWIRNQWALAQCPNISNYIYIL